MRTIRAFLVLSLMTALGCAAAENPDAGVDSGVDVPWDSVLDTWTDPDVPDDGGWDVPDTALDTALDDAGDVEWDTAADTAVDSLWDPDPDTATDSTVDTGWDTAADTAVDTAVDTVVDTGTDTATDPGGEDGAATPGDDCASAVDLTGLVVWTGFFSDYTDGWSGGSGCGYASGPEVWFTVTVQPGYVFRIEETHATNTTLQRVAGCGSTACEEYATSPESMEWYNAGSAAETLTFVLEAYSSGETGAIVLELSNDPAPEGYTCDTSIDVTSVPTWTGSYADFGDLWDGGSGCGYASGPEAWFHVTVPDGQVLTFEETSTTNVTIDQLSACGSTTCIEYATSPEQVSWFNDTGAPATLQFVVEAYSSGSTSSFTVETSVATPPGGYECTDPIDVTSLTGPWSASFADYDDWWDGGSGCGYASGPEAWFTATVPAGNIFTFSETSSVNVTIQRVSSCGTTTCTGYATSPEDLEYFNDTGSPVDLVIVLEAYNSTESGTFTVEVSNSAPPVGYECPDAIDVTPPSAPWSETFAGYGNWWDGGSGCGYASGRDVWLTATVPDGEIFSISETTSTNVTLQQVGGCGTTTCTDYATSPEEIRFYNDTGSAANMVFVLEAYSSTDTGAFTVETSSAPPPPGYVCADAIDLAVEASPWTGTYADHDDWWDGGSGCGYASGDEMWFSITLADGLVFWIEETSGVNVTLQQVTSCATTTCETYATSPERLTYYNDTGSPVDLLYNVEAYSSTETGTVTVEFGSAPPPEGYTCPDAVDADALAGPWTGSFADYADRWDGGSGCGYASGPEIWFEATVPAGNLLVLEETSGVNTTLQLVSACGFTSCLDYMSSPERLAWYNATGVDATVHVVVEAYYATETGTVTVEVTNEPGHGYSCDNPIDVTSTPTWTGDFSDWPNDWSGGTGCGYATGPEVWFSATVAPSWTFTMDETTSTDVVIQQVDICTSTACLGYWDVPESFSFGNTTGSDVEIHLAVERRSGTTGSIALDITNGP